ncbi:MAG: hypothetical protein K1X83_14620 [Oligoflexia bacterium]|nr:hypothetical protein [Oligoflexia bacterium]
MRAISHRIVAGILGIVLSCTCGEAQNRCDSVAELSKVASELRGLPFNSAVNCVELPPAEFDAAFRARINPQIDLPKLQAEGRVYKLLGFVPSELDYSNCILESYFSETEAFFREDWNDFILRRGTAIHAPTAVHELVHALQNQHFHLKQAANVRAESSDALLAKFALIEGDATEIERRVGGGKALSDLSNGDANEDEVQPAACQLPEQLDQLLAFPYEAGERFVRTIWEAGGVSAVNRAFADFPTTTAEVLHPEWYLKGRAQDRFLLPNPKKTQPPLFSDRMGEFFIRTYLELFLPARQAVQVAEKWQDDQLALELLPENRYRVQWRTLWESEAAAKSFKGALLELLAGRFHFPALNNAAATCQVEAESVGVLHVSQAGSQVTIQITR